MNKINGETGSKTISTKNKNVLPRLLIKIEHPKNGIILSTEQIYPNMFKESGNLKKSYTKMHRLFMNLNIYLSKNYSNYIDPIEYLYYLYYKCKLKTTEIYDNYAYMGGYESKNKESFEKLFKECFNWKLRKNGKESNEENNNNKTSPEKKEILKLSSKIKISADQILLSDLKNKKSVEEIIIYILHSFGVFKEENDACLASFTYNYKKIGVGFEKLAHIIKGLISEIKPEVGNIINIESIRKTLEQNYNKYYNSTKSKNQSNISEEILSKMRLEIGGIQTYEEFQKEIPNNHRNEKWYISLDKLKYNLEKNKSIITDPILYMVYLYSIHGKGLSVDSIFEEIENHLHINKANSFSSFLLKLKWQKRLSGIVVMESTRNKLSERRRSNAKKIGPEIEKQRKEGAEKVLEILEQNRTIKKDIKFNINEYNKLKNIVERVKYIFDYLGYIKKNDFQEKINSIASLSSNAALQTAIQYILDNLPKEIQDIPKINFNKGRITELRKGIY